MQELEAVVPWSYLVQVIAPFYPTTGRRGRPPVGLTRMLRMYVAQQCFGLSDEETEDAIYDSQAIRSFVGIDLSREIAPDAMTLNAIYMEVSPTAPPLLAFAVPTIEALMDGMRDNWSFEVLYQGKSIASIEWHDGLKARDELKRCLAGKDFDNKSHLQD